MPMKWVQDERSRMQLLKMRDDAPFPRMLVYANDGPHLGQHLRLGSCALCCTRSRISTWRQIDSQNQQNGINHRRLTDR